MHNDTLAKDHTCPNARVRANRDIRRQIRGAIGRRMDPRCCDGSGIKQCRQPSVVSVRIFCDYPRQIDGIGKLHRDNNRRRLGRFELVFVFADDELLPDLADPNSAAASAAQAGNRAVAPFAVIPDYIDVEELA